MGRHIFLLTVRGDQADLTIQNHLDGVALTIVVTEVQERLGSACRVFHAIVL
jgi:hypothetical protein